MSYQPAYATQEPARGDIDAVEGWVVVEFGAPWCPHCIGAQPAIEGLLLARDDVRHFKIEDGSGRPLGRSFRVKLWPTLVLMKSGGEIARVVRPRTAEDLAPLATVLDAGGSGTSA